MEKLLFNLIILCLTVSLLSACGEKKITVKGADGTEYESYQDCCAAQDFQAAHQYLTKMQNEINLFEEKNIEKINDWKRDKEREMLVNMKNNYSNAKSYVVHQEALYLIAEGTEYSVNRLMFLRSEYGSLGFSNQEIMDLALSQSNEYLAEKMLAQDVTLATETNVQAAIANNMESTIDIMLKNNPDLIEIYQCAQYYQSRDEITFH